MKIKNVKNSVTTAIGRKGLQLSKNSPHLMFGAGVVGVVGTVVLASRATLQVEEVLADTQDLVAKVNMVAADHPDKYTSNNRTRDLTIIYSRSAGKLVKLYGPAIVLGVASIGLLTGAHVTLTKRNTAVMAAYATVDKAFKEYRQRVRDEYGDDKDRELFHGVVEREVYTERENGEPVIEKKRSPAGHSQYARFFDANTNKNAHHHPEYNTLFLQSQQNYFNNILETRGHVFLNEVYAALGLEHTKAGAVVGWIKGEGDGAIDFGIWSDDRMVQMHDFLTGHESAILLDFNVDGVIYDKI